MEQVIKKQQAKSKKIAFTAMCSAILCVLSPLSIYVGVIPYSLGLFAVLFVSGLLDVKTAVVSVAVYIVIGMIGVPVFAGFTGGVQKIVGVTGGYIVGYIPTALITSFLISKGENKIAIYPIAMILGTIICYIFGTAWFAVVNHTTFIAGLSACVIPFILPDLIKVACASVVTIIVRKSIKSIINR